MLGIVIINYNSFNFTIKCIDSIISECKVNYKIITVDNGSINDSYNQLRNYYSSKEFVTILRTSENKGYSSGVNIGIKFALENECENIIISNNDILFLPNSIEIMLESSKKYKATIVGPKIVNLDKSTEPSPKKKLNFWFQLFSLKPFRYFDLFQINKKNRYSEYRYDKPLLVDGMVSGACFLITDIFLKNFELLDEKIFLYYEEDDLALRMENKCFKILLNPEAEVIHLGSSTVKQENSLFQKYYRYTSSLYVLSKHNKINYLQFLFLEKFYYFALNGKNIEVEDVVFYRRKFKDFCNTLKKDCYNSN